MDHILPSQQQELEQLRTSSPLRDQLVWSECSGEFIGFSDMEVPCVRLRNGAPYLFSIARFRQRTRGGIGSKGDLNVFLRPGLDRPTQVLNECMWSDVRAHFKYWLTYLERELKALSLWDTLVQNPLAVSGPSIEKERENEPFGPAEILAIEASLDDVQSEILDIVVGNAGPDEVAELRDFVEGEFADLKAAAKTQNRRAWARTFLGVGASFSIRYSNLWPKLAPYFNQVWEAITQAIRNSGGILPP